jgi:deoxyribose-phosphate aldolase
LPRLPIVNAPFAVTTSDQSPGQPGTQSRPAAALALRCLDLTSLSGTETPSDIDRLCQRAQSPWGAVAAVCVWPRWVRQARAQLPQSIAVAAVANFPSGALDPSAALADIDQIAQAGAQEVDAVLPWRSLMAGETAGCAAWLRAVRKACGPLKLKLIIESGDLADPALIALACDIGMAEGVDFLKTSTGKTATGATLAAADTMLSCIARDAIAARHVGFKASGGVRSVADAQAYAQRVAQYLGDDACTPSRFRLGASGLLDAIEQTLSGQAPQATQPRSSY